MASCRPRMTFDPSERDEQPFSIHGVQRQPFQGDDAMVRHQQRAGIDAKAFNRQPADARMRKRSALRVENRRSEGCRCLGIPAPTGTGTRQPAARARTRPIERKPVADVPLTVLFLK